jgi:hypothetical protein
MSNNTLYHDPTNPHIKQQRNCITPDGSQAFNLHYKSLGYDDPCFIEVQTKQSVGPGNYTLTNLYDCTPLIPTTMDKATAMPIVSFSNSPGIAREMVDESTGMRFGATKKFPKCPQQLFTRPYLTVPYAGRGPGNVVLETQLQNNEDTGSKRSTNTLSGISIPNYFTPLIDHLAAHVQNESHIIQETVDPSWIRAGMSSRLLIRDADYLKRAGCKNLIDKKLNQEFWQDRFMYL